MRNDLGRDGLRGVAANGQFLKVSNLKDCAAELASQLSISVDIDVDLDVDITTETDINDNGKKDSVKCSIGPAGGNASGNVALGLLAAAGLATVIRRRRTV